MMFIQTYFVDVWGILAMAIFNYSAEAELSPTAGALGQLSHGRRRLRQPVGYGRFARAADAIRFAMEELPPELLLAAQLKVAEERFDGEGIRRLYESAEYPLTRRPAERWAYETSQMIRQSIRRHQ